MRTTLDGDARTSAPPWVARALVMMLCIAAADSAMGQTPAEMDAQIAKLDDESFQVREGASKQLKTWLGELTGANLMLLREKLRKATGRENPPGTPNTLERQRRAERINEEFDQSFPLGTRILGPAGGDGKTPIRFAFFRGNVDANADPGRLAFVTLERKSNEARKAINGENFTGALEHLNKILEMFEDPPPAGAGISNASFDALGLVKDNGQAASRAEVRTRIQTLIGEIQAKIAEAVQESNNAMPAARGRLAVNAPGSYDVTRSLRVGLSSLVASGVLDVFMPIDNLAASEPPPGYQYVGVIYDLQSNDTLLVSGTVTVRIEFGPVQHMGNSVKNPADLRMVRVANGTAEILSTFTLDAGNHALTATYLAPSPGGGLDQFGDFAVVQPGSDVPAVGPWHLAGLGAVLLAWGMATDLRRRSLKS